MPPDPENPSIPTPEQLNRLTEAEDIKRKLLALSQEELKTLRQKEELQDRVKAVIGERLSVLDSMLKKERVSLELLQSRINTLRDEAVTSQEVAAILRNSYEQQIKDSKTLYSQQQLRLTVNELEKEYNEKQIEAKERERKLLVEELKQLQEKSDLSEKEQKRFEELNTNIKTIVSDTNTFNTELQKSIANINAAKGAMEAIDSSTKRAADAILNKFGLMNTQGDMLDTVARSIGRDGFGKLKDQLKASVSGVSLVNAQTAILNKGISKIVNKMIDMAMAIDKAESGFRRLTGGGGAMEGADKDIRSLVHATTQLGGTAELAGQAYGDLFTTFTDFSFITQEQRKELGENAIMLKQYGIETKTFAGIIQTQTKILGNSTTEAAAFARELNALAQDIGVAPAQMAEQFAQLGPQLSKIRDAEGAFKDLARVSKATGLEMTKILQITDKFDTFEGAADQVGKLNALLGGDFVNAIDLMTMESPAERFNEIADSIKNAGLSFDSMSYSQKLAYTEAMGLSDVGDLALVLSGNSEMLAGSTAKTSEEYEAQAVAAANLASVQEKLQNIFATIAAPGGPLMGFLDALSTVLGVLTEIPIVLKLVMPALVAYRGITMALAMVQTYQAAVQTKSSKGFLIMAAAALLLGTVLFMTSFNPPSLLVGLFILATAFVVLSKALDKSSKSFYKAAPAVVAIMLSLGGAFLAMSMFVDSLTRMGEMLNTLSGEAMNAFIVTLGILAVGLVAVIAVVGLLVYSGLGLAAAGVFIAIGLAVLMAGAGMSLFSLGIKMIAEAFVMLMGAVDMAKMAAVTMFIYSLAPMAMILPSIMLGFGGLTYSLGMFAIALALVPEAKLQAISSLVANIASAEADKLRAVAESFREIAKAIDEIPTTKAMALSATMATTALASTVVNTTATRNITETIAGTTRNVARAGAGAGGGGRQVKMQDVVVSFNMDGQVFKKKVITIVGDSFEIDRVRS